MAWLLVDWLVCWLAGMLVGWLVGCLVAGWLVGWTVVLILETSFFIILGLEFCTLGHHVGDLGVHWDTKGDTLGSRVGFSLILSGFEDLVGACFLAGCAFLFLARVD